MPLRNLHGFNGQLSDILVDALCETLKSLWREHTWMNLPKFYFRGFDNAL